MVHIELKNPGKPFNFFPDLEGVYYGGNGYIA